MNVVVFQTKVTKKVVLNVTGALRKLTGLTFEFLVNQFFQSEWDLFFYEFL